MNKQNAYSKSHSRRPFNSVSRDGCGGGGGGRVTSRGITHVSINEVVLAIPTRGRNTDGCGTDHPFRRGGGPSHIMVLSIYRNDGRIVVVRT